RLSSLYPSIDPSPHHSADTGCIRPPGSVWKRGGHQRLITDLKEAIAAATLRNPNTILGALISGTPAQPLPSVDDRVDVDVSPYIPETSHQVSPRIARIARTGLYDTTRYSTPSEARQAVITASVRAGLALVEVIRRVETGIWPGLAAMYRRYGAGHRKALTRDWTKAQVWLSQQRPQGVQSGTTSPQVTGGRLPTPSTHASLRRLETHLAHTEPPATTSSARRRRYLLRALLAAAHPAVSPPSAARSRHPPHHTPRPSPPLPPPSAPRRGPPRRQPDHRTRVSKPRSLVRHRPHQDPRDAGRSLRGGHPAPPEGPRCPGQERRRV